MSPQSATVTHVHRQEPVVATFTSAAPSMTKSGSTNLPEGVVHIYRDLATTGDSKTLAAHEIPPSSSSDAVKSGAGSASDSQGLILAVLAVPAWMTPSDFLAFVSPASDGVALLRMIRYDALTISQSAFISSRLLSETRRRTGLSSYSSSGRLPSPPSLPKCTTERHSTRWR